MPEMHDIEVIRRYAPPGTTPDELAHAAAVCERTKLDPVGRQVNLLRRGGRLSVELTIDGLRTVAQRSEEYEGQIGPHWCAEDGKWVDVWLAKVPPAAARVGVLRTGFREPLFAVAKWEEYAQASGPMWKKMGSLMLAKCAEALALRRAFPQELGGLYTSEEMQQADAPQRSKKGKFEPLGGTGKAVQVDPEVQALANELGALVEQIGDSVKREKGKAYLVVTAKLPKDRALAALQAFREKVVVTLAAEQAPPPAVDGEVVPVEEAP